MSKKIINQPKKRLSLKIEAAESRKFDFAVGGQAVMEGVMMRSPNYIVIAVRKSGGEILIKEERFVSWGKRLGVSKIPVLRGMVGLVESMYIGVRALNFSNDVFLSSETKKSDHELKSDGNRTIHEVLIGVVSLVIGLALALFLFKWLPLFITDFLSGSFPILNDTYIYFNIIDGILKTLFFLIYLILIAQLPDIKRLFQYHGAEHKSITTYESVDESGANAGKKLIDVLVPVEAKKHTRFHPRCGTSFIIIVFMMSILVYTLVPTHSEFLLKFLERIAMLPLIAGVSYEALKYSAKHMDKWIVRQIIKPGLWFQKITTAEPDLKQLEVGLASLKRALELESK
ncbi:MAG: DUF1385 domain-containing protein [Candidatus Peregrinibacteria bacterium]|nr:DUF1385 domain-containing protein [Candidatus Peregrinibacteria bacterium]MDZ4244489.1 DUF1385 domain-containing protein [Candidatus Gracilibacteria bacterium]